VTPSGNRAAIDTETESRLRQGRLGRLAFAAAVLLAAVHSARAETSPLVPVERRVLAMGTTFDVVVRAPERGRGLAAIESAVAEVARLEDRLSTWRGDGPLDRLNHAAPGEEIPLDAELFTLLTEVFRWADRTGRAFDPTVLPLVRAWDIRGAGRIASDSDVAAALGAMGAARFRLDPDRKTIARLDVRAGIDEGAWGKGYALDRAAEKLRAAGVADASLDLGGEVLALGRSSERGPWTVPVAHPRDRSKPVALLSLPDGFAFSTSGNSERGRRIGGRMVGHLLDPRTGAPAEDFGSVGVVAPSGFVADVLSTAFFVLGPREGLALSARLRAAGISNEALFLVDKGGALEAPRSPGVARFLLSIDPGVADAR